MKILHVTEVNKGGVITVINELINCQVNDDTIDSIICLMPSNPSNEGVREFKKERKKIFLGYKKTGRDLKSVFELAKVFLYTLKKHRPDIIHLHSSFAGFVCRCVLFILPRNCKIIYCPHAFPFLMQTSVLKKRIYGIIERALQINTEKIICVSKYEKECAVSHGLSNSKLEVIYNGVTDRNKERSLYVRNQAELKVLFVGRFDYQKGFDILIDAIKEIRKLEHNIIFEIIGDYVGETRVVAMPDIDGVDFLGWKENHELEKHYRSCDVLVIPSRWEGFAMVPIEAFMYGIPVIASNNSSFREIVDNGVNGYLFETGNHHELAKILLSMKLKDIKNMKENARMKYEKNYDAKSMGEKVRQLYS